MEPWHNAAEDYEPRVDISYTRGKHAMKYGFSYNRYTKNQEQQANAAGDYGFGQNQTGTGATAETPAIHSSANCLASGHRLFPAAVDGRSGTMSIRLRRGISTTTGRLAPGLACNSVCVTMHCRTRGNATMLSRTSNPTQYINDPNSVTDIWSTQFSGAINPGAPGVQTPVGFGGASYYLNGMVTPGTAGMPHGVVTNDYKTLQPRVGFA